MTKLTEKDRDQIGKMRSRCESILATLANMINDNDAEGAEYVETDAEEILAIAGDMQDRTR